MNRKRLIKRISLYLDGMLDAEQARAVEELIARSADARALHDALRANREMLANAPRLEPAPFFWSRLSHRIEQGERGASDDAILPVPRRWLPALGLLTVAAVAVATVLILQQGGKFNTYVAQQARMVKSFYDATLNTRLFPFLSDVSNDDVLTYAVTGTLPVKNSDRVLEIGNSPERKYWVRMKPKRDARTISVADLSKAVALDKAQADRVSKVLDSYRGELEKSILLAQKDTMAIASRVWEMSNAIIYDIARGFDENQRKEFEGWITKANPAMPAHFKHVNFSAAPPALGEVFGRNGTHPFVVVTPDTACIQEIMLTPERVPLPGKDLHLVLEPLMEQNQRRALVLRKIAAGAGKKVRVFVDATPIPPAAPSVLEFSAPDVDPDAIFGAGKTRDEEEMIRAIRMIRTPRIERAVEIYTRDAAREALQGAQEGLEQLRNIYPGGRELLRNVKLPPAPPGETGRFMVHRVPEGVNIQMIIDSTLNIRLEEMKQKLEGRMRRYDSLSRRWEHSQRQANRVWEESINNMTINDSAVTIVTPDSQVIRINRRWKK